MKTEAMQAKLEMGHKQLEMKGEHLKKGIIYNVMPSDCRGDGYDIAYNRDRIDESGDYTVNGIKLRLKCCTKVGSENWDEGIPVEYECTIM